MKVEVEIIGFELQKKLTQLGLAISLLPRERRKVFRRR